MSLLTLSIIAAGGIKAVVFAIYLYLYLQYREKFLGYWAAAWGIIFFKCFLDPVTPELKSLPILLFLHSLTFCGMLLLTLGIWSFVGQKLSKPWLYASVLFAFTSVVGGFLAWPIIIASLPIVLVYGVTYIYAGLILWRELHIPGLGRIITAFAFIALGIHQFDFPLFRPSSLAHWGYLLDVFLRLFIGTGLLLTYFEKVRYELADKESQFRLLAENAKDIIFRYRLQPTPGFEYISPAAEEITGYRPDEYYTDSELIKKIIHPEDRSPWRNLSKAATYGEAPAPFRVIHKNRAILWVEQHTVPIYDEAGNLTALEGIGRDVTARKQIEQELSRLDRLNVVGQMAANLAHEIRNPLTTVHGYLQVFSKKKDFAPYQGNLTMMVDELNRANTLISDYLSLSKNRLANFQLHDLNRIIELLYPLIEIHASASSHLILLKLGAIPNLLLDEKEIRQLILNLAQNGIHAMDHGKTLVISTFVDNGATVLAVQDEGCGIPQNVKEKIGTPFFTTKENGTGLGLAICYSIASRHGARMEYTTGPDGTTFFLRFQSAQIDK